MRKYAIFATFPRKLWAVFSVFPRNQRNIAGNLPCLHFKEFAVVGEVFLDDDVDWHDVVDGFFLLVVEEAADDGLEGVETLEFRTLAQDGGDAPVPDAPGVVQGEVE